MVVALERQSDAARGAARQGDGASEAPSGLETTRYLCGAAYTDPPFRETVLARSRELVRSLPPEAGIDVKPVIEHSRRAARLQLLRDLAISAVLAGLIVFVLMAAFRKEPAAPPEAAVASAPAAEPAAEPVGVEPAADPGVEGQTAEEAAMQQAAEFDRQMAQMASEQKAAEAASAASGGGGLDLLGMVIGAWTFTRDVLLPAISVAVIAAAALMIVHAFYVDAVLRKTLSRNAFARRPSAAEPAADGGNVVVYSGFSPFVGAGVDVGGWSFAVDLDRGKTGIAGLQKPQPFGLEQLYDHVQAGFEGLRNPDAKIGRKLFVSGRAIRADRRFLPDVYKRPVDHVPDDIVEAYADGTSQTVRHYLCVETLDWGGEMGVNIYVRFRRIASRLFIETSTFLLQPLKPSYYDLDRTVSRRRLLDMAILTGHAALAGPLMLVRAPLALLRRLGAALDRYGVRLGLRREIDQDFLFDYGAGRSLREHATSGDWRVYFQMLDKQMHVKVLEQQLLDGLVDFLDARGVDTYEIKERSMHIMNTGVIVSGGTINAQSLAVGSGARAKVVARAPRVRPAAKAAA